MFCQCCQTSAIGGDIKIRQLRTARQRSFLTILHGVKGLAIDNHRGTDLFEQCQLVSNLRQLGVQILVYQRAAVPSRDKRQIIRGQNSGQRVRILWKFATGLGADKAGFTGFRQAGFQRCVTAKLGQIVIRPGNGRHPKAKFHKDKPFKIQLFQANGSSGLPAFGIAGLTVLKQFRIAKINAQKLVKFWRCSITHRCVYRPVQRFHRFDEFRQILAKH